MTDYSHFLAGETRFEHATYGFGDRYSTVEPLPCALNIIIYKFLFVKNFSIGNEIFF